MMLACMQHFSKTFVGSMYIVEYYSYIGSAVLIIVVIFSPWYYMAVYIARYIVLRGVGVGINEDQTLNE